jgi:hypothetical protein
MQRLWTLTDGIARDHSQLLHSAAAVWVLQLASDKRSAIQHPASISRCYLCHEHRTRRCRSSLHTRWLLAVRAGEVRLPEGAESGQANRHCVRTLRYVRHLLNARGWAFCLQYPFRFEEVNIAAPQHQQWHTLYTNDIPVVHLNGVEIARHGLKEELLRAKLEAAGIKPNQ